MSEKSNILTHLKLFETCVKPILVYCSEIWSLNIVKSNVDLESKYLSMLPVKVEIKFAKALLGVNKQAVNLAVLGELGMYPISIHAFKSAIEFWLHISEDTLLYKAYEANRSLLDSFATRIKILLNKLHFSHVWDNQSTFSNKRLLHAIYKQLTKFFNMLWKTIIFL
jgi:hypothetical protein